MASCYTQGIQIGIGGKMNLFKFLLCIVAVAYTLSACSSTTTIRSTDPEARIYIDGELRGLGQVSHSDTKIVGSTTTVRMEKDGCMPVTNNFNRSEEFDVGACIGGAFVLVPFLWIEKYKPEHNYEFRCIEDGSKKKSHKKKKEKEGKDEDDSDEA